MVDCCTHGSSWDESCEQCPAVPAPVEHGTASWTFNHDPVWQRYIQRFEHVIVKIATKACSVDEDLREDVMQEARIGLLTVFPEKIEGFDAYLAGTLTQEAWDAAVSRYCRNVIRNSILSYLDSYPKGNWYIGRTRHVKDKRTGQTRKVYLPPRFSSLDELTDEHGMQVDERGHLSWPSLSDDGLTHGDDGYNSINKFFGTNHWWQQRPVLLTDAAEVPDVEG